MIKLLDILNEYSHNNGSTGGADAGEPDTGRYGNSGRIILLLMTG